MFSGCRSSGTLILSDEAFLTLEGDRLVDLFGPGTSIRGFGASPTLEELAAAAVEEGSERVVLSPLLSPRARELRSRLPGIPVLAVLPGDDGATAAPDTAVLDPRTALPPILELIEAQAGAARGDAATGEGMLVIYRPESEGFSGLAAALRDAPAAGGEVDLVEFPAETERELIVARIRRDLPRLLVLICGSAGTELMSGLGDTLDGLQVVSTAPPPQGRSAEVYLLRPDWQAIYASLLDQERNRDYWALESLGTPGR